MKVDRNLVVLTRAGSAFGLAFLKRLKNKGIIPVMLVVEHTPFSKRIKMAKYLSKKIGIIDSIRYNVKFWTPIILRRISFGKINPLPDYTGLADSVIECKDINDYHVVEKILEGKPKKVILAQSGIIKSKILDDENISVINCHPGKLPYLRGVDVVKWALYKRMPIEVTLHYVDRGIDTGRIIKAERIKIYKSDNIQSIEKRAIEKSIDILVEAVIYGTSILEESEDPINNSIEPQCYLMPNKTIREIKASWNSILNYYTEKVDNDD